MKLSDFISSLQAIHSEHGDIEVHHDYNDVGTYPSESPDVCWVAQECAHLGLAVNFTEQWARDFAKQHGVDNPLLRVVRLH